MTRRLILPLAAVVALGALPGRSRAQEAAKTETPKPEAAKAESAAERREPMTSLRVQLVITRFQGEKKVASLPYTFVVTAGGDWTRMRMGVDTPIPTLPPSPEGKASASFQYKNVGTKIDCRANERGQAYQVFLGVENSSALTGVVERAGPAWLARAICSLSTTPRTYSSTRKVRMCSRSIRS